MKSEVLGRWMCWVSSQRFLLLHWERAGARDREGEGGEGGEGGMVVYRNTYRLIVNHNVTHIDLYAREQHTCL
jgi:hypothetical protein